MDFLNDPPVLLKDISFVLLFIFIFFLGKWIKNLFSQFDLNEELTEKDNHAVSISVAGYFIGLTAIFAGAFDGPSYDFTTDILLVGGYSIAGIFLLNLTRLITDKLILYKFSMRKELIQDQNPGTGVVEAASFIASGMIIGGAIHGEGGGPFTAFVFYLIGLSCLVLFGLLYSWICPYSLHDEIEKDNTAAGLGFAGGLISIGIIIMKAISGNFISWSEDLQVLGTDILVVFVYLIAIRFIFDRFMLKNTDLQREIEVDQNLGAGLLEMCISICFSVVLAYMI